MTKKEIKTNCILCGDKGCIEIGYKPIKFEIIDSYRIKVILHLRLCYKCWIEDIKSGLSIYYRLLKPVKNPINIYKRENKEFIHSLKKILRISNLREIKHYRTLNSHFINLHREYFPKIYKTPKLKKEIFRGCDYA